MLKDPFTEKIHHQIIWLPLQAPPMNPNLQHKSQSSQPQSPTLMIPKELHWIRANRKSNKTSRSSHLSRVWGPQPQRPQLLKSSQVQWLNNNPQSSSQSQGSQTSQSILLHSIMQNWRTWGRNIRYRKSRPRMPLRSSPMSTTSWTTYGTRLTTRSCLKP